LSSNSLDLLGETSPERHMDLALREARRAFEADEVPVGAVVIDTATGRVVAKAHNQREMLQDPTAHAEVIAITQAAAHYGSWRLTDATLFVTLEPCLMCAGAIVLARIPKVVYGAVDPKAGAHCSIYDVLANPSNNHVPEVVGGIRPDESSDLLKQFFLARRDRSRGGSRDGRGKNGNGTFHRD